MDINFLSKQLSDIQHKLRECQKTKDNEPKFTWICSQCSLTNSLDLLNCAFCLRYEDPARRKLHAIESSQKEQSFYWTYNPDCPHIVHPPLYAYPLPQVPRFSQMVPSERLHAVSTKKETSPAVRSRRFRGRRVNLERKSMLTSF
jgi:hypothetical protein